MYSRHTQIVEETHYFYCATHSSLGTCNIVQLVLVHGTARYVTRVDVWNSIFMSENVWTLRHLLMQVAHRLYGRQLMKIHNCSCGTRAVEKDARYRVRIGILLLPEGSVAAVLPHTKRTSVSRRSSPADAIVLIVMKWRRRRWALLHEFCRQGKRILLVRPFSTSTTVTFLHGSANFWHRVRFGLNFTSWIVGDIIMDPSVLPAKPIAVFWNLFCRGD
jgi:hypothetical protein